MQHIYESATLNEVVNRVNNLTADSKRVWGTMNVAQMMAHCSAALEVATGDKVVKQSFMGKLMAPFARPLFSNEKPFKQNLPTDKSLVITDTFDFNKEKERLIGLIKKFATTKDRVEQPTHVFLGKMSSFEWSRSMYKHLDHHLRQFGA